MKPAIAIKDKCSIYGAETDWDPEFGPKPVCVDCWDKGIDNINERAASQRRYNQAHKVERAAVLRG